MSIISSLTRVIAPGILFGLVALFGATAASPNPAPDAAACGWELFPTADPFPSGNQLTAVAGTNPADVWETGASFERTRSRGYALRWDGAHWHGYKEADPSGFGGQFSGVAAIGADDVWAVGQQYAAANYAGSQAHIEHWDGTAFTASPVPAMPNAVSFLYGVKAFGPNHVWTAGGYIGTDGVQHGYVLRFDGNTWTVAPSADVAHMSTNLDAIAGSSPNDLWTVGGFRATSKAAFSTLAEHWDGRSWTIVPTPNVNANSNVFNAVTEVSPTDVWAIGDYSNGHVFRPLAEHWDGVQWTIVPTPPLGGHYVLMYGASAESPDNVWAVGEVALPNNTVTSLILNWNGSRWNLETSPNVPGVPVTLLNAVAIVPGSGAWAVGGTATAKVVVHTVTEVRRCR